jgi:hypothetical protein
MDIYWSRPVTSEVPILNYIYYLILSLIVFIFGLFKANWQKYEGIFFSEIVRIMILDYFLSLEGLTHKNVGGYINCE